MVMYSSFYSNGFFKDFASSRKEFAEVLRDMGIKPSRIETIKKPKDGELGVYIAYR